MVVENRRPRHHEHRTTPSILSRNESLDVHCSNECINPNEVLVPFNELINAFISIYIVIKYFQLQLLL